MQTQRIETIRKRFKKEWLLIAVTETDKATTTSKKGRLIAHSPVRDEIYKKLLQVKSKYPVLVDYSEHSLPKDVAVIFRVYG